MEGGRRRVTTTRYANGVVSGSVWESRMKVDEVKGGIKVFNGEESPEESSEKTGSSQLKKVRPKQSLRSPIQITRQRPEMSKNLGEQCKELRVSADGTNKKSPNQTKRTQSEVGREPSVSPITTPKTRSLSLKGSSDSNNGVQRNSIQLRKVKSESNKALDDEIEANNELRKVKSEGNKALNESSSTVNESDDGMERNSVEFREAKFRENEAVDESREDLEGSNEEIENSPVERNQTRSNQNCKDFNVCEEKVITSNVSDVGLIKSPPQMVVAAETDDCVDGGEEEWDEEFDEEIEVEVEVEKKSLDVEVEVEKKSLGVEVEVEKKTVDVKEMDISEQTPKKILIEEVKFNQNNEENPPVPIVTKQPSPAVNNQPIVKKQLSAAVSNQQRIEKPVPVSPILKKQPPAAAAAAAVKLPRSQQDNTRVSDNVDRIPRKHNKLQSLVDLVMWRDVSKSAFVFGLGTFVIISSSYTKDLNISLISLLSYLGLVYLAVIFFFRSIICRGAIDMDETSYDYVVGEAEAIWLLRLILPYLNEFLIKLRALFTGDPATTMKVAVLLFVLARCGSSITIWKMAKLGFFGVFTVPKVCSSYSRQLTGYGKFWVRRFRDAWDSCSHKKAVAFGIFTLVWNLSSIVARFWAVFMLLVAFRYYQQSLVNEAGAEEDEVEEEGTAEERSWRPPIGGRRQGRQPTATVDIKKKQKKRS